MAFPQITNTNNADTIISAKNPLQSSYSGATLFIANSDPFLVALCKKSSKKILVKAAPAIPPVNWAIMKNIPGTTSSTPCIMKDRETAGFACPPEMSPKINTTTANDSQWAIATPSRVFFPASNCKTEAQTENTSIRVPMNSAATCLQLIDLNSPISMLNDLGICVIIKKNLN